MNGFILRSGGREVNRFTIDSKKRPPHLRNNHFLHQICKFELSASFCRLKATLAAF